MNNGSTALVPIATLDDDAWDDLLSFIEERRVIPIVGPELLPQPYTLNDVVCLFLAGHYADAVTAERNAIANRRRWGDRWLDYELGIALYAKALADPAAAPALLDEAQRLVADARKSAG